MARRKDSVGPLRRNPAYRVHGASRHYRLPTGQSPALSVIYEIVRGRPALSADIGFVWVSTSAGPPQFWMNLQTDYDLRVATVNAPLDKIKPRVAHSCRCQSLPSAYRRLCGSLLRESRTCFGVANGRRRPRYHPPGYAGTNQGQRSTKPHHQPKTEDER